MEIRKGVIKSTPKAKVDLFNERMVLAGCVDNFKEMSKINVLWITLHVHSKTNFLGFSRRMGHKIYLGEKIQALVKIQNTNMLERYLKDPHAEHGEHGYYKTCSHFDFDQCLYEKLSTLMMTSTEDNCTALWTPDNARICTKQKDINSTFMISLNRFTNQAKDCDSPCRTVVADVYGKNYRKYLTRNYAELYVYYGFDVMKTTEHSYYTFYNCLAEVGGYVALFLGYSFYQLIGCVKNGLERKIVKLNIKM